MSPDRTEPVVLVTPTVPLPGANGLAMRAGFWLDALSASTPVHLVVVPVAGTSGATAWARVGATSLTVVDPIGADDAQRHVTEQVADAEWRAALATTAPLPARVTLAPPSLAREVARALAPVLDGPPAAVLSMREYLVPFGTALARELGARRLVVDLDDDVEPLLEGLGDADAAAYGRLARTWLPRADVVTLASAPEAAAVAARYGLAHVTAVPNAMRPAPRTSPRPRADRLLFVGNLGYLPNEHAAHVLARDVLPRVRAERPAATLDLVGAASASVRTLAAHDGVTVHGFVADLAPVYARADIVALPIAAGAGTRIKVLEAFAHARPLVASAAAVAGLAVEPGREVLVADTPVEVARAVVRVLGDGALADRLTAAGARTLHDHYAPDVVGPRARRVVLGNDVGARE